MAEERGQEPGQWQAGAQLVAAAVKAVRIFGEGGRVDDEQGPESTRPDCVGELQLIQLQW